MSLRVLLSLSGAFTVVSSVGAAQATRSNYPPEMDDAKVEVYKKAPNAELKIYIFNPSGHRAKDRRPAIVFFFGGGWTGGTPKQFEPQCRYLAARGMVAMAADYRVRSRHGVKAVECLRDAKSAIRWVRQNAKRLGVDPKRIAAGGGSAGGHLAASTALIDDLDEPSEQRRISSRPNALVLFNPGLVLAPVPGETIPLKADLSERMGIELERISPYHHIAKGAPPAIIFHGKADTVVPYSTIELFARKTREAGNRCELVGFDGEAHGFFNFGRGGNKAYLATLRSTDLFLISLGYLKGVPSLP